MTSEEYRNASKKYVRLSADRTISIRRAAVLKDIARSYTTLANQLDRLASIQEEEGA
jgi:hypothetical protein